MDIFDKANCGIFAQPLRNSCAARGLTELQDQCRALAQFSVESRGFTKVEEDLTYHAQGLVNVLANSPLRAVTLAQAVDIVARGPSAIAEALYGGAWGAQHLGNIRPGDGYAFIGRGLVEITGRWNYVNASMKMYGDGRFLTNPSLLTVANYAADSAVWFWMSKQLNGVSDVVAITKAINGGVNALAERQAETDRLLTVE